MPWHPICTSAGETREFHDAWPPFNEPLGLRPKTLFRPLGIEHKNCMARIFQSIALRPSLFFELIDRNDIPSAVPREVADPLDIRRIARETIHQVDDLVYVLEGLRQFPDGMRQVWGKVVVEEKVQAANLSSNPTASVTIFGVMSNTRATICLSRPSAR